MKTKGINEWDARSTVRGTESVICKGLRLCTDDTDAWNMHSDFHW